MDKGLRLCVVFPVVLSCLGGGGGLSWDRGSGASFCVFREDSWCSTQPLSVSQPSPICFLLAGSEGKLTVVAQKMSVLSGEGPRRKLLLWWRTLSRRLNERDL